jgi:hypothetical protein
VAPASNRVWAADRPKDHAAAEALNSSPTLLAELPSDAFRPMLGK